MRASLSMFSRWTSESGVSRTTSASLRRSFNTTSAVRCAHLLMIRWDSTSLALSASSMRTPKMAPVEPVMPMMRRRIQVLRGRAAAVHSKRTKIGFMQARPFPFDLAWRARRKARSRLEQMAEPLQRDAALFRRRQIHLRELVAPMPGPTGVDDRPAVGVVADRLALGLDARIERSRPGIADDVDRARRIRAREERPDELLKIGHVDVVVDHDHIAPAIGADMAHGGDMAGLLGMAGIALIHRHGQEQPRIADLVRPDRGHPRHSRLLDALAQQGRAHHRAVATD